MRIFALPLACTLIIKRIRTIDLDKD